MLVAAQVQSGGGGRVVGGLLIFVGIIGLLINFVAGLVLMGLGIVVMAVTGKVPGLMCPNCGVQGRTVGDITYKVTPRSPQSQRSRRVEEVIVLGIGVVAMV